MKKINTFDAAGIIGGTCKQDCVYSYEIVQVNGVASCKLVASCTDKKGNVTTSLAEANLASCLNGSN